jgi:hypothetical protein
MTSSCALACFGAMMDLGKNDLMLGFDKTLCMTTILVVELRNIDNVERINEHMVKVAFLNL